MAEPINIQEMIDGRLDIKSLGEAANGDENTQVVTRLGETYPSAKKALNEGIKKLFENGGLPAEPFTTKALMTASPLADGSYAMVTDDTVVDNNGLYSKASGVWSKSKYDIVGMVGSSVEAAVYGVIKPEWEKGSINSSGVATYAPSLLNRAKITKLKTLAPNYTITVTSKDPNLGVSIATWDETGVYSAPDPYATSASRKVPHAYNIIVKYFDDRPIDLSVIAQNITIKRTSPENALVDSLSGSLTNINSRINGGSINLTFINGSITNSGNEWSDAAAALIRLRTSPLKNMFSGDLTVKCSNPAQRFKVVRYDSTGKLVDNPTIWSKAEWNGAISGYFAILVSWDDDSNILPSDLAVTATYPKLASSGALSELSKTVETTKNLLLTGVYDNKWMSGSYTSVGNYYANSTRLVMAGGKTRFRGTVKAKAINPLQSVNLVEFNESGDFLQYGEFAGEVEKYIDGYFDVIVRWNDNANITASQADVKILIGSGGEKASNNDVVAGFDPSGIPRFSSVPFGQYLGKTLPELELAFDAVVANYQGITTKESIGFSSKGNHEMFAYTLTPDDYQVTIAITMHVHGNERWNPLGFYALLNEMSRTGAKHELILWLKHNVRWYVIPFASPYAITTNDRFTEGVNHNRNYDFLWDLWPTDKGTAVYSLAESRNISNYFKPKKGEIDYHLDLHDIPGSGTTVSTPSSYAYMPANMTETFFESQQEAVKKYLGEINDVATGGKYVMDGGGVTNFFSSILRAPSVTAEHVTQYWLQRGFSPDQQIAKALEQTCCFLYLFRYLHEQKDTRGSAYYTSLLETSFASKEFGIYSWTKAQVYSAFANIGFLTEDATESNVYVSNSIVSPTTIMVISGSTDDDNNSDLTVLRVMQRIEEGKMMFIDHLKNCKLVVVPAIKTGSLTASEVGAKIGRLTTKYSPNYTVLVTADAFETTPGITTVRSDAEASLTSMTKKSKVAKKYSKEGLDSYLIGRYTSINLKNEVLRHAAFPHTVANWVGLVANDLASYLSDDIQP